MVNTGSDADGWQFPVMQLNSFKDFLIFNWGSLQVVNPYAGNTIAGTMLTIPELYGRDLDDVVIKTLDGEEWIQYGSFLFRPLDTIKELSSGDITVKDEISEWRRLASGATVNIETKGKWRMYDEDLNLLMEQTGSNSLSPSAGVYFVFHESAVVEIMK